MNKIRNFSIIAHIDHGKSTLADRILELTNAVSNREMKAQYLDSMELERERGITIKLNAVQIHYQAEDGEVYKMHLIDTPGHVDFTYEVSRSLQACEGAILVIDAQQGIQAQTLANLYIALDNDLEIIPVINKIDLPTADVEKVLKEIEEIIGIDRSEVVLCSAKNGIGIKEILEAVVKKVPAPKPKKSSDTLRALVFDSYYDAYKGVIPLIRVVEGTVKKGDTIYFMQSKYKAEVVSVGVYTPEMRETEILTAGEVGFIYAQIKSIQDIQVGDTITFFENQATEPLPGYKKLNPVVFSGIYPVENKNYAQLKEALEKLKLNDAALTYEMETSKALGFGFRTGFLGLLHLEIIQERIRREFNIDIIATAPSVIYTVHLTNGNVIQIQNPCELPEPQQISYILEPFVKASIMTPSEYVGSVMEICQAKRGVFVSMNYLDKNRVNIIYKLPLSEIVYNFFDKLKSQTKGYASFDYDMDEYVRSNLVKLNILLNGEQIDALATIVHKDFAESRGRALTEKMKDLIPRQMFEIPVQAAIGNRIIARSTIKAMRKDVLAKCYGGDISRKMKLLQKQKEGKKKMKQIGRVSVPQEAFLAILKQGDD